MHALYDLHRPKTYSESNLIKDGFFVFFNDFRGDSLTLTAGSDSPVISLLMSSEEGAVLLSAIA